MQHLVFKCLLPTVAACGILLGGEIALIWHLIFLLIYLIISFATKCIPVASYTIGVLGYVAMTIYLATIALWSLWITVIIGVIVLFLWLIRIAG